MNGSEIFFEMRFLSTLGDLAVPPTLVCNARYHTCLRQFALSRAVVVFVFVSISWKACARVKVAFCRHTSRLAWIFERHRIVPLVPRIRPLARMGCFCVDALQKRVNSLYLHDFAHEKIWWRSQQELVVSPGHRVKCDGNLNAPLPSALY